MNWPACSPDLNPAERVGHSLQMHLNDHPPRTIQELTISLRPSSVCLC